MKDKIAGMLRREDGWNKFGFTRLFFIVCFLLTCMAAAAQREYFVFIQEPSGRPFYVRLGEHSYSSSAGGHLILPSMRDSLYNMYVGFPKGQYREHLFNVQVENSDMGFELKFIDGAWQLLDLKTMQLKRAAKQQQLHQDEGKRDDAYSRLMAGVVNDSAVLYSRVEVEDSVQVVDTANVEAQVAEAEARERDTAALQIEANGVGKERDSAAARKKGRNGRSGKKDAKSNAVDTVKVVRQDTAANDQLNSNESGITSEEQPKKKVESIEAKPQNGRRDPRDIIRYSTENIAEGKLMIYIDRTAEVADTIRIIVPRL